MVFNPFEGQIHSGKMMKALQQKATSLGIYVITGTKVQSFEEANDQVLVHTEKVGFKCSKLALCTNAFTKELLPEINLQPGRGVVLVTKPISNLPLKGTFHYDEGYYYFRDYEHRVIFGGGRNLDIQGEASTEFGERDLIKNKLIDDLNHLILPNMSFEVEHYWSGIMAFGPIKQPILEQVSERVFAGVRLGGMGVAIGSKLGYDLAYSML